MAKKNNCIVQRNSKGEVKDVVVQTTIYPVTIEYGNISELPKEEREAFDTFSSNLIENIKTRVANPSENFIENQEVDFKNINDALVEDKKLTSTVGVLASEYSKVLTNNEIALFEDWSGKTYGTEEFTQAFKNGAQQYFYEGTTQNTEVNNLFSKLVKWFKNSLKEFTSSQELNSDMVTLYDTMFSKNPNFTIVEEGSTQDMRVFKLGDPYGFEAGAVRIEKDINGNNKIFSTNLKPDFRGQGLGSSMYRQVLEEINEPVLSDVLFSEDAKKVWKSLEKRGMAQELSNGQYVGYADPSMLDNFQYPQVTKPSETAQELIQQPFISTDDAIGMYAKIYERGNEWQESKC